MSPRNQQKPTTKSSAVPTAALRPKRQLHQIAANVLRLAKDRGIQETEVHIEESIEALTRFANNTIHQHVAEQGLVVSLRTSVDGRTARVTTNRIEEDALRAALEDSLSLASHQPKDPQLLPMPGKQKYRAVRRFHVATAALTAEERARAVKNACQLAERRGQVAAGIFSSGQGQSVLVNSRGLATAYRQTHSAFSVTMQQDSATSWAKASAADVRRFDPLRLAKIASEKAARARNPVELAPGKFTVILEPAAVLDLVGLLFYDFAATAVADKRSCLSGRIGKPVFGENVTISDDVYHPEQLGAPFDGEGIPRQRVVLVDRGVVKSLVYSRRSAKQVGIKPTGHGFALPNEYGEAPLNLVVAGGNTSLEEMVASTDRGLLVTRLWYIREVDPYEKIMTGMTRDGLFLVEKGKIAHAVRNFRFNQSVLEMLRNVQCLGPAGHAAGEEASEMVAPPMKICNFNFSEVTKF
jgi:predicted Zn-dependent protease